MGADNHVAERAEIVFLEPELHGGEDARNLAATSNHLGVVEVGARLRNPRNRHLSTFQPIHVGGVFSRSDQFIVAAIDKLQKVTEELADVGSANEIFEMQLTNAAPQVDPHVLLVENAETLVHSLEQPEAIVVKCRSVHALPAQQPAQAVPHLCRRIDGVGESQDFVRLRVPFADQALNAIGQDRSLAGACARDHEHRSVNMFNGFALAIVWSERSRTRTRLRKRHCESGYHLPG